MWTCIKCSYAYNQISSDICDICRSVRSPPSLTEPSLITVTKDSVRYTPPKDKKEPKATLATLEQDLDDDLTIVPDDDEKWVCCKCTLLNDGQHTACAACGGSKLRSLLPSNDATLRKGEFWVCPLCTLRNPVGCTDCKVCRSSKNLQLPKIPGRCA